jgi:regulatory protein YycH of two-component signal transduction system YycFG
VWNYYHLETAKSDCINRQGDKITSPKDYDMVIIDEAHKFRNDTAQAYDELQRICKTKNNEDEVKKVMLISATPLNNRPDDLYNQILLFQDGNNSTLSYKRSKLSSN